MKKKLIISIVVFIIIVFVTIISIYARNIWKTLFGVEKAEKAEIKVIDAESMDFSLTENKFVDAEITEFNLFDKHIKLAEISSANWGLLNSTKDNWMGRHYTLYTDGEVNYYDSYSKSGKKNEVNSKISNANVALINHILKDNINTPSDMNAYDGTGWHFSYFNESEEVIGKYSGYIYNNKYFNLIIDIIENKTDESSATEMILDKEITIKYDGERQEFYDKDQNKVYPIYYDSITYLPVECVANLYKTDYIVTENVDDLAKDNETAILDKQAKIYYNDKYVIFKDSSGNVVYPITYNGLTYIPLRGFIDLLNINFSWDASTRTIDLSKKIQKEDSKITGVTPLYGIVYSNGELIFNRTGNIDTRKRVYIKNRKHYFKQKREYLEESSKRYYKDNL